MTTHASGNEKRASKAKEAAPRRAAPPQSTFTHEQIADRARQIWQSKGHPAGKDEENWREAEAQLHAESPPR